MRDIKRNIKEKWLVFILIYKIQRSLNHEIWKILTICFNRVRSLVKIMESGPMKKVVVVIVYETISDSKELIKSLFFWAIITMCTQVPFPEKGRFISRWFKSFCESNFFKCHVNSFGSIHVALCPVPYASTLRVSSCH